MSMEKGTISFRVVRTANPVGEELEKKLEALAYSSMDEDHEVVDVTRGVSMWGNGEEVKDQEAFLRFGTSLYFARRMRKKRVPQVKIKEFYAHLLHKEIEAEGLPVSQKRRKELREMAEETLLGQATVDLSGVRVSAPLQKNCFLVESKTVSKSVEVQDLLAACGETQTAIMTPNVFYQHITKGEEDYFPYSIDGQLVATGVGVDFLTWLWMAAECNEILPDGLKVVICGDIELRRDKGSGQKSQKMKLSSGAPWETGEPEAAFRAGKKVQSARFMFQEGKGTTYTVTVDEDFYFKALDISDEDKKLEPQSFMSDRHMHIVEFLRILTQIFKKFLDMQYANQELINSWIEARRNREELNKTETYEQENPIFSDQDSASSNEQTDAIEKPVDEEFVDEEFVDEEPEEQILYLTEEEDIDPLDQIPDQTFADTHIEVIEGQKIEVDNKGEPVVFFYRNGKRISPDRVKLKVIVSGQYVGTWLYPRGISAPEARVVRLIEECPSVLKVSKRRKISEALADFTAMTCTVCFTDEDEAVEATSAR